MLWIWATAALLVAMQPTPAWPQGTCEERYSSCMRLCVKQSGLHQSEPERCMLACVQSKTRCAAMAAKPLQPMQPEQPEEKPAPAPTAPVTAAPAAAAASATAAFRWDKVLPSFKDAVRLSPASNPDIPLH
jgi:hypothetical protein